MSLTTTRLAALRSRMEAEGTGLVALGPGSHMQWALGYHPHPDERLCLLLVGLDAARLVMPALNAEEARRHTDLPMDAWEDAEGPEAALAAALATVAPAPAAVEIDETMRADFALAVLDALPGTTPRAFAERSVGALRMIKDATDYRQIKANALHADKAMRAAFDAMTPGMTEREVRAIIRDSLTRAGASVAFNLVASGPNGAFPHHASGDRELRQDETVLIDMGARIGGYFCDMTRMGVIGTPPEGYADIHDIVEAAVQAAMAAARPGVAAKEVDAAARGVIAEAGYGPAFVHRTGHGLGIDVHEPPYLTATSETVLEEGMVFSIEPGIYLPDRFGIRLEEIVILRADGPEVLSELPRTLCRR